MRYAHRLSLVTRLELVVVFAVVAVMVSKRYSEDTGTLVGLAVGIAVAWRHRTGRPRPRGVRRACTGLKHEHAGWADR